MFASLYQCYQSPGQRKYDKAEGNCFYGKPCCSSHASAAVCELGVRLPATALPGLRILKLPTLLAHCSLFSQAVCLARPL